MKVVYPLASCVALLSALPAAGAVRLSISDAVVIEGNSGTRPARFRIKLDAPPEFASQVVVTWQAEALTAVDGDFVPASGTLSFSPGGPTAQEAEVPVVGDQIDNEGSEVFLVRLVAPESVVLADGVGAGVILDDEDGAVRPAKCDLDRDGRSNLLVQHPPGPTIPEPHRHRPLHQDWGLTGPLAVMGSMRVEYDDAVPDQEEWALVAMDNFDANGTCDLFWEKGDLVALTLTDLGGELLAPHPHHVLGLPRPGEGWRLVGSGDLNGDALADLVWWQEGTAALQAWLRDTEQFGGFGVQPIAGVPPTGAQPLALFSPYPSGQAGILWRGPTGGLDLWRLRGTEFAELTSLRPPSGSLVGPAWRLAAVGDLDGDGDQDIVWQQREGPEGGGAARVWLMFAGPSQIREIDLSPAVLPLATYLNGVIDGPL